MTESSDNKQLLHLVFGGELSSLEDVQFRDLNALDIVGMFPDYASALAAWKAKAQQTVDNAHMRYFIVHMHRLLTPGGKRSRVKSTAQHAVGFGREVEPRSETRPVQTNSGLPAISPTRGARRYREV